MVDICLKASTEVEMIAAIPFARSTDEDGREYWVNAGDGFVLDVIGPVCVTEGIYGEDGVELSPPVFDNNFHVNIRCNDEIATNVPNNVKIWPDTPIRTWF